MIDKIANELLKPLLNGSKERLVTVIFLFSVFFTAVEASTQFMSLFLLNRRIDTTNKLLELKDIPSGEKAVLISIQSANVSALAAIEKTLENPSEFLLEVVQRFLKGVWPAMPFAMLILWLGYKFIPKLPENPQMRVIAAGFWLIAFRIVVVFAIANGLVSAYWNTGVGFWRTIAIFPLVSAIILLAILSALIFLQEKEPAQRSEKSAEGGTNQPPAA